LGTYPCMMFTQKRGQIYLLNFIKTNNYFILLIGYVMEDGKSNKKQSIILLKP
jgi:hypothetical protein